jgi:hypothetical protein
MDYLAILEKTPDETIPADRWVVDFSPRLEGTEAITSAVVTVTDLASGTDVTATLTSGDETISGDLVGIAFTGGTEGHNYEVKVQATTDSNGIYEEFFAFRVTTP